MGLEYDLTQQLKQWVLAEMAQQFRERGFTGHTLDAGNIGGTIPPTVELPDIDIDDLTDVNTTTTPPDPGQALVWDDALSYWRPGSVGSDAGTYVLEPLEYLADDLLYSGELLYYGVWGEYALSSELAAHIANTSNPHAVTKAQVGLADVQNIKSNFAATVTPTVGDDTGDGYAVGSLWVDLNTDTGYLCCDAALGAAVWKQITA